MPKIQWSKLPPALRDHLLDRLRDRQITAEDLYQLKLWRESEPDAPDGDWFKDFGSFKICGRGKYPKTFLLEAASDNSGNSIKDVYRRPGYVQLRARLHEQRKSIHVVAGTRQDGKTTMVRQVLERLRQPVTSASADSLDLKGRPGIAKIEFFLQGKFFSSSRACNLSSNESFPSNG